MSKQAPAVERNAADRFLGSESIEESRIPPKWLHRSYVNLLPVWPTARCDVSWVCPGDVTGNVMRDVVCDVFWLSVLSKWFARGPGCHVGGDTHV